MTTSNKIKAKFKLALQRIFFTQFNKYDDVVWLIGTGRSGTTWCSSLINHSGNYRELFEPFHPEYYQEMAFLGYHRYARPNEEYPHLDSIAEKVFTGKFSRNRTDQENDQFKYHHLLVKDIFANLFAKYLTEKHPQIKPVLLIRHPLAVAYSVYQKRNWSWMTDPRDFLKQAELVEDYLQPFQEVIETVGIKGDYIECQVLIWCVLTYVPLLQFKNENFEVVFYEELLTDPHKAMERINKYLNPNCEKPVQISEEVITKPSWVTSRDREAFKPNDFETNLSQDQIARGLEIIAEFGLDKLYNGQTPNRAGLSQIEKL